MKRKILCAFLIISSIICICLLFSACISNSADSSDEKPLQYAFSSDKLSCSVTGLGNNTNTDIIIPAEYNEVPVISIFDNAFKNTTTIKSITLSDNIKSIGDYAFSDCTNLKIINFGNGLETIGKKAFSGCINLENINIPNSLNKIDEYAFENCTKFTTFYVPNNVECIKEGAFSGCSEIIDITIPFIGESIKFLNDNFQYPLGYIFGKNEYIGGKATVQWFYHYYGLAKETYYIPTKLKKVNVTGGNIVKGSFYGCNNLTNINIPETIQYIGDYAFYECESITSISIPKSVTYLGYEAFYCCFNLKEIEIPSEVSSIEGYTFAGCHKLDKIVIPTNVTSIGNYAFSSCWSLTNIIIPNSVKSIGEHAFEYCENLDSLTIGANVETINNFAFNNCTALTQINYNATLCEGLERYNYVFNNAGIKSSGITVYIGSNVKEIPRYFFCPSYSANTESYMINITKIVFLENSICESISAAAFEHCINLEYLILSNSLNSISEDAFRYCKKLQVVYFLGTFEQWENIGISYFDLTLKYVTVYYYSENEPLTNGNYWHYVNSEIVIWTKEN